MTDTQNFRSSQIFSEASSTSGESSLFSRTLLIFDFDDTLFCTKYFDTFSLPYKDIFTCRVSLEEINPCLVRELKQLENTIIDLFSNLCQIYDIIIVSNADMTWINNCLTHFLEELKDYINDNDIKIYSAKNMLSKFTKNKYEWKVKCFKKVINDLYKDDLYFEDFNVISIGDRNEEKKAVFNLGKIVKAHKVKPKFIRMISFPSASTIILQLKYLKNNLINLINENNSIFRLIIQFKNDNPEIKCVSLIKEKNEKIYKNCINEKFLDEKKI